MAISEQELAERFKDLFDRLHAEALNWALELWHSGPGPEPPDPEPPDPEPPAPVGPVASGVGAAHWMPDSVPDGITWGYETSAGRGVFWREIEAQENTYDFTLLRKFLEKWEGKGVRVWPSIMTVSCDASGVSKAPAWMMSKAPWLKGACSKNGIFAPWEANYLLGLRRLIQAFQQWVGMLPGSLRDVLGGIVCMSGGMYGETQLWSCSMEDALMDHYGLSRDAVRSMFSGATKQVLDIYLDNQSLPVMVQLGWPYTDAELVAHAAARDGGSGRVYVKWNGLDPTNVGDGKDNIRANNNKFYTDLFLEYPDLRCGFEFGHPNLITEPKHYENLALWATAAGACFLAVQGGPTLDALRAWDGFEDLNEGLKGNC